MSKNNTTIKVIDHLTELATASPVYALLLLSLGLVGFSLFLILKMIEKIK